MKKSIQQFIPKLIGAKINAVSLANPRIAAEQAFSIFCTPRAGRIKEEMKTLLDPAKHSTFISDGAEIQTYHWNGTGKKILLIHGWESNTHRWHLMITALQKENFDIYAIDAPGHGYSTGTIFNIPRYAAALEMAYQKFNPDLILGHSVGGLATIFHQHIFPNSLFSGIVLLAPPSDLEVIMTDYKRILSLNERTMTALEHMVIERFGYNFKEFSGAAFAKAFTTPSLIIHDKYDLITPVAASRTISQNWKKSTYFETEGFGHSLYQEEVRDKVIAFLKKID